MVQFTVFSLLRSLLCMAILLFAVTNTAAEERYTSYDIQIEVEKSGAITVTETINLIAENDQIKRGIFRELPRYYSFLDVKLENDYQLLSIKRNGKAENYTVIENGNAVTWRIGRADYILPVGPHSYEIKYRVPEQIRRHRDDESGPDRDELYWNATGSYVLFPVEKASATIIFPEGANIIDAAAYIGRYGENRKNYTQQIQGNVVSFSTTQGLLPREGLTVSAAIKPNIIAPMSAERKRELEWIRNGGKVVLGLGGVGLFLYYIMMWNRVGRDPVKPPVFPRYAPPKGYSPAAVHFIHFKGFRKMDAMTALMMGLSLRDVLDIKAEKKKTTIISAPENIPQAQLLSDETQFMKVFFPKKHPEKIVLDRKTDARFYKRVIRFKSYLRKKYSHDYHRSNAGWGLLGIILSVVMVFVVLSLPVSLSGAMVGGFILLIAALNILFFILLRAPTKKGAQINSEIDGFKLYLNTAEEKRINTANPIGDRPPLMTVELYERFLPYAVALGVEKPWTKQFEKTLPLEAKEYRPRYAHGSLIDGKGGNPFKMSEALATAMTAGVAAAAPVSQSSSSGGFSSGSGGGGFSGGGGGGGGSGGW
ncbi:putative membrane protein DUF2207 [Litorimonas taeanensis]|uniref:Putative membrane protein DUF2207 n=1 Tax=Litorimonas taeanensis TaxID=568099 RepID=A0A420WEF8_9PROT|nr:DUF2207 domain-containing protein [Litorimonas taeanensis]RKQ69368.1 putative membrane protein DUF2207 [Litorimonas taeanensis]